MGNPKKDNKVEGAEHLLDLAEHQKLVKMILCFIAIYKKTTISELVASISMLDSVPNATASLLVRNIVDVLDDTGVIDYIDHTCYATSETLRGIV